VQDNQGEDGGMSIHDNGPSPCGLYAVDDDDDDDDDDYDYDYDYEKE